MNARQSSLAYMGTQSQETASLDAGEAARRAAATPRPHSTVDRVNDSLEAAARQAAVEIALPTSHPIATYVLKAPFKALLVAAAAGALAMGLLVTWAARSGE